MPLKFIIDLNRMIPESDEGDLAKQPAVRQLAKNSNLLE